MELHGEGNMGMEEVKETTMKIYAVRDRATGKLVSDITNPKRKYWDREGNCRQAISHSRWGGRDKGRDLEMVEFTLVENYDERQISSEKYDELVSENKALKEEIHDLELKLLLYLTQM